MKASVKTRFASITGFVDSAESRATLLPWSLVAVNKKTKRGDF